MTFRVQQNTCYSSIREIFPHDVGQIGNDVCELIEFTIDFLDENSEKLPMNGRYTGTFPIDSFSPYESHVPIVIRFTSDQLDKLPCFMETLDVASFLKQHFQNKKSKL